MARFSWRIASWAFVLVAMATLLIWPAKGRVNPPSMGPTVCACCSDEGEWYQRTEKTDFNQLRRVRFATAASTYEPPSSDGELASTYVLSHTRNGNRWQLRFRDEQGKTGTLSFALPLRFVSYGADMHDGSDKGLGPLLYKEWRLTGQAEVAGEFKRVMKGPARFLLILQGKGNNCTEAENFKHWTLQINSAGESHSFYGALSNPQ
jgi:hypothetical protein